MKPPCCILGQGPGKRRLSMSKKLKGVAAAPGIAIAPIVQFHSDLDFIPTYKVPDREVPREIARLAGLKSPAPWLCHWVVTYAPAQMPARLPLFASKA